MAHIPTPTTRSLHGETIQTTKTTSRNVRGTATSTRGIPIWVATSRESTASSLSRVHFRHYIAAVEDVITKKINCLMATIPMMTGISPQRWHHTLNVMLKKVAGKCSVKKLQISMLFEADFNNNNKWLGRAVMQNAEGLNKVAPEQYGSHAQKQLEPNALIRGYSMIIFKLCKFQQPCA